MDVDITETDADGWTVVTAAGEIDVASAPDLRDRLIELVAAGRSRLVVDLESVDFIDSTGLGVLVGAARRARAEDAGGLVGDVRLVCTNSRILKVFGATGLDQTFIVAPDVPTAIAAPTLG